jgi:Uma2 family endonuclease
MMGMTWKQICADPVVAELPYKVESDQWGNIVMSPPPGMDHSRQQSKIAVLLNQLLPGGEGLTEFPLRTSKGVKGIDAVWISDERLARQLGPSDVASIAPEICIEVISPSNKRGEIEEKKSLYFERGALECWTCDRKGRMAFFKKSGPIARSELCPDFPTELQLKKPGAK